MLVIDRLSMTFTAQAGATVKSIVGALKSEGLALPCLPTILDLTIAGMIATATHSTGAKYQVMSAYVQELELMCYDGSLKRLSRTENPEIFKAACVNLGAFGPILTVKMTCQPYYHLSSVRTSEPIGVALENLDRYVEESDHLRMYLYPYVDQVVVDRVDRRLPTDVSGTKRQTSFLWDRLIGYHLLQFLYFISTFLPFLVASINQLYFWLYCRGRQAYVDSYEEIFCFDCLFSQYVMEWAIPKQHTVTMLKQLKRHIEDGWIPAHFPIEVRFSASDDLYASPAYGRETCWINVVMYRPYGIEVPYKQYWQGFEGIARLHEGRPHLAKDHSFGKKEMIESLPEFHRFCQLRKQLDPEDLFQNDYINRIC